jgi:hypoxanthine phosphoribosyltransferase
MEQAYRLDQRRYLQVLYSTERIQSEVARLAKEINAAYQDRELLVVVILNGALFFAADLLRALRVPIQMDFVKLSSYQGTQSTGKVLIKKDLEAEVAGRDVLVVEDIVDTGVTLSFLTDILRRRGAKSLSVCTLIDKTAHRVADVTVDFAGISCAGGFLVGYGLDLDERFRELPAIYQVVENPVGGLNDTPV